MKNIGSIKISENLTLDGVLHVPQFNVNLLSVSKLTQGLKCIVIFFDKFCIVHDMTRGGRLAWASILMGFTTSRLPKIHT